jgi:hypothetical protein
VDPPLDRTKNGAGYVCALRRKQPFFVSNCLFFEPVAIGQHLCGALHGSTGCRLTAMFGAEAATLLGSEYDCNRADDSSASKSSKNGMRRVIQAKKRASSQQSALTLMRSG